MRRDGTRFFDRQSQGNLGLPLGMSVLFVVSGVVLLGFLSLPVLSLFFSITPENAWNALQSPHLRSSLLLSVGTTMVSAVLIFLFGTPVAYLLARMKFRGKGLLSLIVDLPMVIPPSVAGIGLLLAFGRRSPLGGWLAEHGVAISFTTAAVVMAQVFIAAPFFIRSARVGFSMVDGEMEAMARSLGAGWWLTFRRITLQLARPYLVSGLLTSWARALGEFGATILFAGNFLGKTETMPLAIYSAMNEDLGVAIVLANLLLLLSITLMVLVRIFPVRKDVL